MKPDLAYADDVAKAWRPLTTVERGRAEYYIGQASRLIRRRWPNVDVRIEDPTDPLTDADASDVVVALVLSVIPSAVPGARSWSTTTGPFSHSVTLPAAQDARPMALLAWMIDVFEVVVIAPNLPKHSFPAPASESVFGPEV